MDEDVLTTSSHVGMLTDLLFTLPALPPNWGGVDAFGIDWLTWKAGCSSGMVFPALARVRKKRRQWKIAPQAIGQS